MSTCDDPLAVQPAARMVNLLEHIVILMLENRSFDHMLGYLSLESDRDDVYGLRAEFANEYAGRRYPVHHLASTVVTDDPAHSASDVDLQVRDGKMNGFVASFAHSLTLGGSVLGQLPLHGLIGCRSVRVRSHGRCRAL
jgi:phospholipase C